MPCPRMHVKNLERVSVSLSFKNAKSNTRICIVFYTAYIGSDPPIKIHTDETHPSNKSSQV